MHPFVEYQPSIAAVDSDDRHTQDEGEYGNLVTHIIYTEK